jgi:hypothetical protein
LDSEENTEQNDAGTYRAQVQKINFFTLSHKHKKLVACINHNRQLLYVLVSQGPLPATQLGEFLGWSKHRIARQLKQLHLFELIKKTKFESHVLYAVNGHHLHLIQGLLEND